MKSKRDKRHWFYRERYRRKRKSELAFDKGEWRKWKKAITVDQVKKSLERLFKGE